MPTPPKQPPRSLRVDKVDSGFVAAHIPAIRRRSDSLQIEVAFDCLTGSPWSAYEPFDFDVSKAPISVNAERAEILELRTNKIVLRVMDGFKVRVTGFDTSRDLIVNSKWLPPTEPEPAKELEDAE